MRKVAGRIFIFALCAFGAGGAWASEKVPIVVPISEIREQVNVFTGEDLNDGFGAVLTALGDVNGDGRDDFAFLGFSAQADEEDVAYIFYGATELPRTIDVAQWPTWGVRLHSLYGSRYPVPRAGIGDLDGDGYDDMVFKPCFPQAAGIDCPAYILFGGPDLPRDIDTNSFEGCRGCTMNLDTSVAFPGVKNYASGDVNGDGLRDVVFATSSASPPGYPRGAGIVYVVLGTRPFPDVIDLAAVGGAVLGCTITCSYSPEGTSGAHLGSQVSAGYDFNSDGMDDVAIAAPDWTENVRDSGAVFVVFGRREWPPVLDLGWAEGREKDVCFIVSSREYESLGEPILEGNPDITGDGIPDLLISRKNGEMILASGADLKPGMLTPEEITTAHFYPPGMNAFYLRDIGDWDGDGMNDLAAMSPTDDAMITDLQQPGAVYLVMGRTGWPAVITPERFDRILGESAYARFGETVVAGDINGDGEKDLVVAAPGYRSSAVEPGKIYIIPHGVELLGVLECLTFAPRSGTLAGGARMFVDGKGFDAQTRLFVGDTEAEVLERPDSRRLVARIPPAEEAGVYRVRITRGDAECIFVEDFTYYESIFPREVNVLEPGWGGCRVIADCGQGNKNCFVRYGQFFEGGEDVTGDGLGDVLFLHDSISQPPWRCHVHLLHGAPNLPPTINLPNDLAGWATTFALNYGDECGDELFGDTAVSVGDMNGDGVSELAIAALGSGQVFIVLGGELPTGVVPVDTLPPGRLVLVSGCPTGMAGKWTIKIRVQKIGDVNGDGLADLGILALFAPDPEGYFRSAIAFVLGDKNLPQEIPYSTIPRMYGKLDPIWTMLNLVHHLWDVDGDGCDDISFIMNTASPIEPGYPPAYYGYCIFFGRRQFAHEMTIEEEMENGGACAYAERQGNAGVGPGGIGDQNGDGIDDIGAIVSFYSTDRQFFRVIYGGDRTKLCKLRSLNSDDDFDVTFQVSPTYYDELGVIQGGRDLTGDGVADILLTDTDGSHKSPPSRAIGLFGGELERKAGPLDALEESFELVNYEDTWQSNPYLDFPVRFDFAGDVNGDGYEDLVTYDVGDVYIYFNPRGSLRGAFVRGDANQDSAINIADAIAILTYLFASAGSLPCMDAADLNDDETLNIADVVRLLMWLFADSSPPPPPTVCGPDPAGEILGCAESVCR
jgi:hypothetical protein